MRFSKTSDTSGASFVAEISDEVAPVFAALERAHPEVDIALWYAFRCLPEAYGRRDIRRFSRRDNALCMDLTFSEDRFRGMSRDAQRHELGHRFVAYTAETLSRYDIDGLDTDRFMEELRAACRDIGWLKEAWEVDR